MKLRPTQIDESSLLRLSREAATLLERGEIPLLADRFDYVFSSGTSPAIAIEEDLPTCVAEFCASSEPRSPVSPSMSVKYFEPNAPGLFALVECVFIAAEGCPILAELVVTSSGEDKHLVLATA